MPAQSSDLVLIQRGTTLYKASAGEIAALASGGGGGSDPWGYIHLTADAAVTTTAFQNVSGMSFSAASNTLYEVEAFGAYKTAATTTGIALALGIPSGSVVGLNVVTISATALGGVQQIATGDTTGATTGVATANTNTPILCKWLVAIGGTGGTVQLRARSEVASSAATLVGGLFMLKRRAL